MTTRRSVPQKEVEKAFRELGVAFPGGHPHTGEPLRTEEFTCSQPMHEGWSLRPEKPQRSWVEEEHCPACGEITSTVEHALSAKEYLAAIRQWEKACERWDKTMGQFHTPGKKEISATFRTASGRYVQGVWDGGEWQWVAFSESSVVQHDRGDEA